MTRGTWVATEAVTPGHPDKVADQLADAVLDAACAADPEARAGVEVLLSPARLVVSGRIGTRSPLDAGRMAAIVDDVLQAAGYGPGPFFASVPERLFDLEQGPPAAATWGTGLGIAFGYATEETPERMPRAWVWAHHLVQSLVAARTRLPFLGPDAKVQVSARIDDAPGPVHVAMSVQVDPCGAGGAREAVEHEVVRPCLAALGVQPGRLTIRAQADRGLGHGVGLTGRKLGMDTYGGMIPWSGGALSGKDLSRFDRIGALAARAIALKAVREGLAGECLVTLAAEADGLQVGLDPLGTSFLTADALTERMRTALQPDRQTLAALARAIAHPLAIASRRGHFGDPDFFWEGEGALDR